MKTTLAQQFQRPSSTAKRKSSTKKKKKTDEIRPLPRAYLELESKNDSHDRAAEKNTTNNEWHAARPRYSETFAPPATCGFNKDYAFRRTLGVTRFVGITPLAGPPPQLNTPKPKYKGNGDAECISKIAEDSRVPPVSCYGPPDAVLPAPVAKTIKFKPGTSQTKSGVDTRPDVPVDQTASSAGFGNCTSDRRVY